MMQCTPQVQCGAVQPLPFMRARGGGYKFQRMGPGPPRITALWVITVQCSAVQCSAVQCSAVQCSAV
jgi:hypothetical protein